MADEGLAGVGIAVEVWCSPTGMPDPAEVERVYAAASALPPLGEPPSVARMFAGLYRQARALPGAVAVTARDRDELVGFAYGHPWSWSVATDSWSRSLAERLGEAAAELEGAFAVELLAVAPEAAGAGLGRRLLTTLLETADRPVAWLQTTDRPTPALRLYRATGWEPLGHGPDAPDGRPGLVLVWRRGLRAPAVAPS